MASSYPTSADSIAANKGEGTALQSDHPAHHNLLADAVNAVQSQLLTISTYAVTLTGTVSDPTLGTGSSVQGFYSDVGNQRHAWGRIRFGTSGTAAGSGNYLVLLPAAMSTVYHSTATNAVTGSALGTAQVNDSSTPGNSAACVATAYNTTKVKLRYNQTNVGDATPFAWGASDEIVFDVWYVPA